MKEDKGGNNGKAGSATDTGVEEARHDVNDEAGTGAENAKCRINDEADGSTSGEAVTKD